MKNKLLILAAILFTTNVSAQTEWKMAGDRINTPWASKVDPAKPLPEYPRPQMLRSNWINLNGLVKQIAVISKTGCGLD